MTVVTLSHIVKRFPSTDGTEAVVLDDFSLRVNSGEVLCILGPSGSGKSSVLRIVAGLLPPDSGTVAYDGVPLAEIEPRDRGVGMVFQDGALMPHWISEKTVGFFLALRKREHEIPERVRRISEITGIGFEKLLDRKPAQLSGGERQRVAIARALARDPRVFLFDEPFSSIDAALRTTARVELKRLLREFPVTSLYVTHDQSEAESMAHRVAVMKAGKIVQIGEYRALLDNPIDLFVATFVGTPTMNLLPGEIRDHHWVGRTFGGYPVRTDLGDGERVIMGARPERFTIGGEGGQPARVEAVEDHYAERVQITTVVSEYDRWTVSLPLAMQVKVGDVITCAPMTDALVFFDARAGTRIG